MEEKQKYLVLGGFHGNSAVPPTTIKPPVPKMKQPKSEKGENRWQQTKL